MPDISINMNGVSKLLQNLNPREAASPDGIPCCLLQAVAKELAPALAALFHCSFLTREIPEIWKHALAQPVLKKGNQSQAANCRPISLTSVCRELLKYIVRSEITAHLDRNSIITDAQHSFQKRRSCETQLILPIDDLAAALNRGGRTDTILLDFVKPSIRFLTNTFLRKWTITAFRAPS